MQIINYSVLIVVLLLINILPLRGQTWTYLTEETKIDSSIQDSLDNICYERGHVLSGIGSITLIGWAPTFVDLPDRTLLIWHDPNSMHGTCMRCQRYKSQPVQANPDTSILWIKKEKEIQKK